MRHFWFVTICQFAGALTACVTTAFLPAGSIPWMVVAAGLIAIVCVALGWLNTTCITHSLQQVESGLRPGGTRPGFTIAEFDQLRERVAEQTHRWTAALGQHRQQLQLFTTLLERIDDRAITGKSTSTEIAEGLQKALARVSRETQDELEAVRRESQSIRKLVSEIDGCSDTQLRSLQQVAGDAHQVAQTCDEIRQRASQAQATLEGWLSALEDARGRHAATSRFSERMQGQLDHAERRLRSLHERTRDLDAAVSTIGSISKKTDLLSLNASIESFRGGDHGRGFSFVAEEVRRLAEQATQASREVGSLLQNVQAESQDILNTLATQQTLITQILESTGEADSRLQALTHDVQSTTNEQKSIQELAARQQQQNASLSGRLTEIVEQTQAQKRAADNCSWNINSLQQATSSAARHSVRLQIDQQSSAARAQAAPLPRAAESLLETIAAESHSDHNSPVEELTP